MKYISQTKLNKHIKNAYKNATIKKIYFTTNPLTQDITYKTILLSNDIKIDKTYYSNKLAYMTINKLDADDLNCYSFYNGAIRKA